MLSYATTLSDQQLAASARPDRDVTLRICCPITGKDIIPTAWKHMIIVEEPVSWAQCPECDGWHILPPGAQSRLKNK